MWAPTRHPTVTSQILHGSPCNTIRLHRERYAHPYPSSKHLLSAHNWVPIRSSRMPLRRSTTSPCARREIPSTSDWYPTHFSGPTHTSRLVPHVVVDKSTSAPNYPATCKSKGHPRIQWSPTCFEGVPSPIDWGGIQSPKASPHVKKDSCGAGFRTSARSEGGSGACERQEPTRRRKRHRGDAGGIVEERRRRDRRARRGRSPVRVF
jgi:hypothetical protein